MRETGNEHPARIKCYELNACNDHVARDRLSGPHVGSVLEVSKPARVFAAE